MPASPLATLRNIAAELRIDSIRATTAAGSGHPTTCMSAAEIVATLFFAEMRFDPRDPQNPDNDRFVLSKGHGAPVLYAAWAQAGLFPREALLTLRRIDSDLEGHPTPRLSFVDVATGSLGQGVCAAVGIALNARRIGSDYRTYVLLGDGELAEGSVWEAASLAEHQKLDNLCAIIDVNALGQSQPTPFHHDLDRIAVRWKAFGWHALTVDGHDVQALLDAYDSARTTTGRPTIIVARTLKGKGVSWLEGRENWHGKPLKKDEAARAIAELEAQRVPDALKPVVRPPASKTRREDPADYSKLPAPAYALGDTVATREAWGTAVAALGGVDPRVVVLDADVKNSTFSERFEKQHPARFVECFIAEQVMVGAAMGLAARGAIPFPSTFACFLSRAADFIRMAGISFSNVKFTGSHVGVSIGEDGPSQMALEDLAMMRAVPGCTVLYPCDGVSTERLVAEMARTPGLVYMRTSRPKTAVIYGTDERFPVGGSKVLRQTDGDVATVVAAGVTVYEALKACDELRKDGTNIRVIDAYSVHPIDAATLSAAAEATGGVVIAVEDHYSAGGLGDAVAEALAPAGVAVRRLAVREVPRSGQPDELLDRYGISARHIVQAVREARVPVRR
ncbi:MAG TPA: transketolase [Vicinamibacterales bacterium]|nr:transketolase [Vicinamibacterales bacterium]